MASAIEQATERARDGLQWADDRVRNAHGAAEVQADELTDRMPIMDEIRLIGGALVFLLLIVFVLTEIYNAVEFEQNNTTGEYEGPFGGVVSDLEDLGAVALGLLVLGLLVVAASAIMRFFGNSGFGGR